ncbi:MAG: hypothetical protein WAL97_10700 [Halobacteriota archaeon]
MSVVLVLVSVLVIVAGCTSANPASPPSTQTASTSASATPSPSQPTTIPITPSLIVTPSPPSTPAGGRIATTLSVWEGYMGQPALWLDYPTYHVALKQGGSEQVRYVINGTDGKHPCGLANYYIDNQAAGGTWDITKPQPLYWQGCPGGLPGGAGGLYLYPNDTAKLAVGWHTLKIDYLGDSTYAPSQFVAQFLVVP